MKNRYFYRRYLGFMPIQFCMICGRVYWGGFPRLASFDSMKCGRFWQWLPWWMDYCSQKCADYELSNPPNEVTK